MPSHLKRILIAVTLTAILASAGVQVVSAQSLPYPPYGAWRGRIVARDGHGRYTKYRWGNGLTPTGGAVISAGIEAFAPVVMSLATGARDAESRDAGAARGSSLPEEYIVEQRRANRLLEETARLVGYEPAASENPPPPSVETQPKTMDPKSYIESSPWGTTETGNQPEPSRPLDPKAYSNSNPWQSSK